MSTTPQEAGEDTFVHYLRDRLQVLRWEMVLGTGNAVALESLRETHNRFISEIHDRGISSALLLPEASSAFDAVTSRVRSRHASDQ